VTAVWVHGIDDMRAPRRVIRWTVLVTVIAVVGAVVAVFLWPSQPSSTTVPARSAAPTVPVGWHWVQYGPLRFAVPATWAVYGDGDCRARRTPAVYLGNPTGTSTGCRAGAATAVEVGSTVGPSPLAGATATTLVGGLVAGALSTRVPGWLVYIVDVPAESVIVEVDLAGPSDWPLAHAIAATIAPAPNPQPLPAQPVVGGPTYRSPYCAAVGRLQSAGVTDDVNGDLTAAAAPYLSLMLATAPRNLQTPLRTLVAWVDGRAPAPIPPSVRAAEEQAQLDWFHLCGEPAGPTVQSQG
jgi:hypothetical protein